MARGGYRKPTNGAVVSPPGALSKRKATENVASERMTPSGGKYGERKDIETQMASAPTSKGVPTPNKLRFDSTNARMGAGITPLDAETQRPNESPETGMPFGEGPMPGDIGLNLGTGMQPSPQKEDLMKLSAYLPMIERAANSEDAPQSLRTFVKYLKGM